MNDDLLIALQKMQDAGWGVGGKLVEADPRIEANYSLQGDKSVDDRKEGEYEYL